MTTPSRQPSSGRRRRRTQTGSELSRDVYVDAAVNLIENRGAAVLSARKLAAAVGADPSALYRYFPGVDDVLRAVADRMIGIALERWTPGEDWMGSLTNLARALYHVYAIEFPRAGLAIATRTTGLPNELRSVDITIGLLREGGFDDETAARVFRSIADFLLGHAMLEGAFVALPPEVQEADLAFWQDLPNRLRSSALPHAAAAAPHLRSMMPESSFEAGLELTLRGIAATPRRRDDGDKMARVAERVSFSSTTGPALAGLVDLPEGEVRGWGVFAHGFTLGKDCPAASRICKQLASEGIGMLRFDNLGLGDSEGDWGDGSFSHKVADTVRAVEFMNSSGRQVRLLVGHSFGGAAAIAAAHECPTIEAVVSVGAPYDPSHVEHNYDALVARIEAEGEAPFPIGGKALTLKRAFVEDVRAADLRERIRTLRRALLVMHSPTDNTVGIANASHIFRTARHPRSFVSLEGADHLLTGKNQAARAARIISAWADPYL